MKNIKNSFVLKSLFAFAFVLMVAVVVTFCEIPSKMDSIPNHQEVSKPNFEIGGSSNVNRPSDGEIGGPNATRTLYAIGGNGGGNGSAPRNIYGIGGSQIPPQRQISETYSNDYAIGLNLGQETSPFSDIVGNSVPRNVQEIGGSQSLPPKQKSKSSPHDAPIGGNLGQQRSLSVTNSVTMTSQLIADVPRCGIVGVNSVSHT